MEFSLRNISFAAQSQLPLSYKEQPLVQKYVPDFICYDQVIVELKAVKETTPEHKAQLINYLKATGMKVGLLVNFGAHPKATVERFVL